MRRGSCSPVGVVAAIVVSASLAACEREHGGAAVRRGASVVVPELQRGVAAPAEILVHPIELESWDEAPAACREQPTDAPARAETAAAMAAFTRWVGRMIDPAREPAGAPSYLLELRRFAKPTGRTTVLVAPDGYGVAWAGVPRVTAPEQAARVASGVAAVELEIEGTVERGRGVSPVRGVLRTHLFTDSRRATMFGVGVEICVMPAVAGVAPVYLHLRSIS